MISIIIPTIRPENIPALLKNIEENTVIPHEVIWQVDHDRIGTPKMVKKLVELCTYDWIVFLGDDTLLEKYCIDNAYSITALDDLWLVGFNDHDTRKATHWLANKKLLDHLENREFFYTGYIHNFCDDELRLKAIELKRYGWCPNAKIKHNHPCWTGLVDPTYEKQQNTKNWIHDEDLFIKRNIKK